MGSLLRRKNLPVTTVLLLISALFGVSCRKVESPVPAPIVQVHSKAVAVVAGVEISADTLQAELRRQFRVVPESGLTTEQKLTVLDRLVRNEAIHAQARARGFDQSAEMQARIKNLVVTQFREQQSTTTNAPVTEAEILAAYQADDRYGRPAAVRGAVIFLKAPRAISPEKRAELQQRADAVLTEAQTQSAVGEQAFAQVVAQHSDDASTRYRGGDTGWMTPTDINDEASVAKALLAVGRPGGFAPVIETPGGFYVARLLEKREAGRKPLAEVQEVIRYQLSQQKQIQVEQKFHEAMKAGLEITVNRELVEAITLPASKREPSPVPGATTAQVRTEP